MKIVLFVVTLLTSFMLLKGSEFLSMVLIRIVFLHLINLVRLSFSCVLMEPIKSKQLYFLLYHLLKLKCLPLGFVCLFVFPLGICTLNLLRTPLGFFTATSSSPCWTKKFLFYFFLHKVILFLRRLAPPYRILNSEDLPVRFRLVHCSPRPHAPLISIPGPFRNSESGHLPSPRSLLCLQGR